MRAILGSWKRAVLFIVLGLSTFGASIEAQTTEGLDAACIARIRRPDSALMPSGVTVAKTDLARLAGNYTETEMDLLIKVESVDNHLRIIVLKGPEFPPSTLIPISPTCFRWEGEGLAPGLTVVFHAAGDKTELTIVQPGKPEVVMKRTHGLR